MSKNQRPGPGPKAGEAPIKHGLHKFRTLNWRDEEQITHFMMDSLSPEEQERLRMYIRTLVEDETLDLTNFEIKRIAVAMLALDRGDNWFFQKFDDNKYTELGIELQKFLAGKEAMIIETLRKSKTAEKKPKNLWDQLDSSFKNWEIKGEGAVEGIDYVFEAKKKTKPKMLHVVVTDDGEEDADEEGSKDESGKKKSSTE